jgi:hypothetical protein
MGTADRSLNARAGKPGSDQKYHWLAEHPLIAK